MPKQNTPRGLTPQAFVERIAEGEDAKAILDSFQVGYSLVARWRKNNIWFAEAYPAAVLKAGRRLTQGQFDALYPGWKTIFVSLLGDAAERGDRPTKSGVIASMNEMGIPVKMSRLYACITPGSRFYDEDFAMEVETHGNADYVNGLLETFKKVLLEEVEKGKSLKTALDYLKADKLSPLKDRQELSLSTREEKIQTRRTEIRATIVSETHQLGSKLKEVHDVPRIGSSTAEVGSGATVLGEDTEDGEAEVQEEGGEEEGLLQEVM